MPYVAFFQFYSASLLQLALSQIATQIYQDHKQRSK